MYTRMLSLGLAFMFLLSAAGGIDKQAVPPPEFNLDDYEYVEDQLLVSFKPTVGSERSQQVLAELGVERIRQVEEINLDVLRLPPGLSVEKALEIFNKRPEVRYAEPNFILSIAGPLEAEIVDQWGLQKIRAQAAWDLIPQQNRTPIVIGIVDTGIDRNTPDLAGRLWSNADEIPGDGIDNDNNGRIDDTWGWDFANGDNDPVDDNMHGTAVSSVTVGNQDGLGVAGVCPWCKVMAVKVMTAEGQGSLDVVASGILYAANNGAQVINLSLAGSVPFGLEILMQSLKDAVDAAWNAGVFVVAAAGNNGTNEVMYPAGLQNAFSVGSTDVNDGHSCFSNYADGYINVSAPGSNIPFIDIRTGNYGVVYGSGTSLAAPHVAGLAGLLLSQDPSRTNQQLGTLIETTTVDLGPEGMDAFFGSGRIDALRALQGVTSQTVSPHQDYVLSNDATAYAHARKLARSSDGTLHLVWYEQEGGQYKIQYASSTNDGVSWSPRETIFSSVAESYHPAIAVDNENIYVVFPTLSGVSKYQVAFSMKPLAGGSWTYPAQLMGGTYNAVRPDIYLDPSNNKLHVVASSFDDANFAYYRSASKDESGLHWSAVVNVDFQLKTRYATVYAYGQTVYIASRITDGFMLGPAYYVGIIRSFDGGVTWQDGRVMDSENTNHSNMNSAEYGLSMAGYKNTLFLLNEWEGETHFRRHTVGDNIENWEGANLAPLDSKWPTVTAGPDGTAWLAYVGAPGNIYARHFKGGAITNFDSTEVLDKASYPNFKYGTNYGQAEWVTTYCDGSPFSISNTSRATTSNTSPYAFFNSPVAAVAGTPVAFDASASYDPDGDPLTYVWNFGDSSTGSGVIASHTYPSSGTFNVTLTVNDGRGGSHSTSKAVVVDGQQFNTYTLTYSAGANGTISGDTTQIVNEGTNGTAVTAVPNPGYHFVEWSDGSTANPRTDTNVTANVNVTANFAINTYTLTYSAGTGGTISGTSPQTVNHGSSGTAVTAVPNTGYHFVNWSDGSTANPRTDSNVTANVNVTANFAIDTYTLTYSAGANGTISGTSPQTVNHGGSGTAVTAVPNTGYHFVDWSDGVLTATRTDLNVTADVSVTANFAINTYTLTYSAGTGGTISGTSPQTVNHGADGTAVTAVPNTGYHFVKWSDQSTANPRTDTNVTGNVSVTASFALNTYTLTYSAGTGGSISGTSPQTVNYGGSGTAVTAVPNTGYSFVKWSDGVLTATRTDSNVTGNVSVTASFALNTYTLTYTAGANGSISGTSPQTVNHGADGTAVTAVPDPGYHFVKWSDESTANPRTDTNVTGNVSVTASFEVDSLTLTYVADADIPVGGTVAGLYTNTHSDDGNAQSITERESGGKPSSRYSYLEHKWVFNITSGNVVTFYANAWSSGSSDGDSFTFAYSTNDVNYTEMFTISSTGQSLIYDFLLPNSTQGTVYIRVTDTDQTKGNLNLDTINIDYMYIQVDSQSGPPPASPPSAPSGLEASAVSSNQIDLSWVDNADNEDGFHIQRSEDQSNWTQIANLGADVTAYSDTTVSPDITYFYRVRAYNGAGSSAFSNTASAITTFSQTGSSMHIGDLDGSNGIVPRSRWEATVTITVHRQDEVNLQGVLVTGTWSEGGTASCTTNAQGQCSVTKNNLKTSVQSIIFTVTNLELSGSTYDPGVNHDLDGDSNGTAITIISPY